MKNNQDDYYVTRSKDDKKQKVSIFAKDDKCHNFGAKILELLYEKMDLISIFVDPFKNGFEVKFFSCYGEDHAREVTIYFVENIEVSGDQLALTL